MIVKPSLRANIMRKTEEGGRVKHTLAASGKEDVMFDIDLDQRTVKLNARK